MNQSLLGLLSFDKKLLARVLLLLLCSCSFICTAEVSNSTSYRLKKASVNSSSSTIKLNSYRMANVVGNETGAVGKSGTSPVVIFGYVPRVPWIDHDGDGMYSSWEIANSLNQYQSSDAYSDTDADHMTAIREFLAGLDPNDDDQDNDGIKDGDDAFPQNPGQWQRTLDSLYRGATFQARQDAN